MALCEDPKYSKYFKMLKAEVPLSWVRHVIEMDGRDSRVLDLDPNKPLGDQLAGAVNEFVNGVVPSDVGEGSATLPNSDHNAVASMSASTKEGEITNGLRAVPFDEDISSNNSNDSSYNSGGNALSQAAVARMKRLKAILADGGSSASSRGIGRGRQTTDEVAPSCPKQDQVVSESAKETDLPLKG